jgi:mono/diheme cytochrome c family protein
MNRADEKFQFNAAADQLGRDAIAGVIIEVDSDAALLEAARRTRDAGYTRFDAHSPYPIHGADEAVGIKPTKLPWLVVGFGAIGALSGLFLQWWTNASSFYGVDISTWLPNYLQGYDYRISGKPEFSLPANIPIIFEVTVLLAAFATVFGMLALNDLPRWYNALFSSNRFRRVTDDGYFISIPANDPQFDETKTTQFADSLGGQVERVYDLKTPGMPRGAFWAAWVLGALLLLPPVFIAKARIDKQEKPRIHIVQDMDNQPRYKAQAAMPLFADGRAMRPPVPGTVAREDWPQDPHLDQGGQIVRDEETGKLKMEWFDGFPEQVTVDVDFIKRGKNRYDIYCATCHGYDGRGNGMVNKRAVELQQGWVPAQTLVGELVRERPDGHIYNTIKNGLNNMGPYGDQIEVKDRWAVVAYIRALQRATEATLEDVPPDQRTGLR